MISDLRRLAADFLKLYRDVESGSEPGLLLQLFGECLFFVMFCTVLLHRSLIRQSSLQAT